VFLNLILYSLVSLENNLRLVAKHKVLFRKFVFIIKKFVREKPRDSEHNKMLIATSVGGSANIKAIWKYK
jgi:hypothetical protein